MKINQKNKTNYKKINKVIQSNKTNKTNKLNKTKKRKIKLLNGMDMSRSHYFKCERIAKNNEIKFKPKKRNTINLDSINIKQIVFLIIIMIHILYQRYKHFV